MEDNNQSGLDSIHTTLIEMAGETELVEKLVKDYHCTTALERSLCEVIAISYGRVLSTSRLMDQDFNLNYPSKEKVSYLNILSKELDRESRNYLTAINTLLDIRNPKMTINVNTENAFLGENQQFNNNRPRHENIKD